MAYMMHSANRQRITGLDKRKVGCSQLWRCVDCTELLPSCYEVDHIIPHAVGGSNDFDNLQALCPNCHAAKSATEQGKLMFAATVRRQNEVYCWTCDAVSSRFILHVCGDGGKQVLSSRRGRKDVNLNKYVS